MRRPVLLQRCSYAGIVVGLRHSASEAASTVSYPCWEGLAEHGQPTHGVLGGGLVLQDIPMLGEQTVFEPDDVGRYPIGGFPDAGDSALHNHTSTLHPRPPPL